MMDYDIRDGRTHMYFKGQSFSVFDLSYATFEDSKLPTSANSQRTVRVSLKGTELAYIGRGGLSIMLGASSAAVRLEKKG
jgi:hypothetical protein